MGIIQYVKFTIPFIWYSPEQEAQALYLSYWPYIDSTKL